MRKWLIICTLIGGLLAMPPSWSAILFPPLGVVIGLGLGLFVFVGIMCEVWDHLTGWD